MARYSMYAAVLVVPLLPVSFAQQAIAAVNKAKAFVLRADSFSHYIDTFNENDEELYRYFRKYSAWQKGI